MRKRKMKPEKWLGMMLAAGLLPFAYIVPNEIGYAPDIKNPFEEEVVEPRYAISYESDGDIWSYDLRTGLELSAISLVDASSVSRTEAISKNVIQASASKASNIESRLESMGLESVEVIIQKRDSAWSIQRELAPDRNIYEMIRMVKELNDGYSMHPIYEGQTYTFIREANKGESQQPAKTEPIDEPAKEEAPEIPVQNPAQEKGSYVFFEGKGVLYAYSKESGAVQKVTVRNDGTLESAEFGRASEGGFDRMSFGSGVVGLHQPGEKSIEILPGSKEPIVVMTVEEPIAFALSGTQLIYSGKSTLYSMDLTTGKSSQVMVRGTIGTLIEAGGKIYALTTSKEGAVSVMKYNPDTLTQEASLQFKGEKASFIHLSESDRLGLRFTGENGDAYIELDTRKLKHSKEKWIDQGVHESELHSKNNHEDGITLSRSEGNKKDILVNGEDVLIVP